MSAEDSASGGPDRGSEPHVFVGDLEWPVLEPSDHHHLTRALRLRPGDSLTASDGRGGWRRCRLDRAAPERLEPVDPIHRTDRPRPALAVGFALVKGQKPELVVQKLTELGIDVILPFVAERSVVRWDVERAKANDERLGRVAREAAMQSKRSWLPEIARVAPFASTASYPSAVRADRGGAPPSLDATCLLIGPEGGWSDAERQAIPSCVGLGSHVLRAETAAIAAGVVLAGLREGLWMTVRSPPCQDPFSPS